MDTRLRTPTFRTLPSVRRVYETLQPKSEMKDNPEAYILHVHLPGFTTERIKITYVASSRMVRITGERPIEGHRWSKFDQTYPVPEICEAEALQGKFELGTLILTMPKKFISQVSPKQELKTTQDQGPPVPSEKPVVEAKPEKAQETIPPQYTITKVEETTGDKKSASLQSPVKGPADLKAQKPEDEKVSRASIPTEPITDGSPPIAKRPIVTKPQNGHEGLETKVATAKEQLEGKTLAEDAEKERISKKEVKEGGKPYDMEKGIFEEKGIRTREVSHKEAEPSGPKVPEKRKEDMIDTVGNIGIRELAASASHVVTRIAEGKWNEEEKHLVANMGAAVLVIAALGAYVSYRFASSGRT